MSDYIIHLFHITANLKHNALLQRKICVCILFTMVNKFLELPSKYSVKYRKVHKSVYITTSTYKPWKISKFERLNWTQNSKKLTNTKVTIKYYFEENKNLSTVRQIRFSHTYRQGVNKGLFFKTFYFKA